MKTESGVIEGTPLQHGAATAIKRYGSDSYEFIHILGTRTECAEQVHQLALDPTVESILPPCCTYQNLN